MKWGGAAVGLLLAGCVPTLSGAPCHTDDNCPTRQYCDGANGHCQYGPPPPTRVISLQVSTPAGILPLGATVQATATALLQSGDEEDVTATATWSSANERVAEVSNDAGSVGSVLAVGTGEVDVQATLDQLTAGAHLVVTNAELVSLVVTVDRPVVAPRSDVTCSAVGFFTDGTHADLSSLVAFTSSQPAVVAVPTSAGSAGQLTALGPGTAHIRATYQKLSASTDVTVTGAALVALSLSPLTPWVSVGSHLALQGTGLFSDGTAQPVTANVQWTVLDPALAFFSASSPGSVEGFAPGSTVVQVQAGAVTALVPLLVSDAPLLTLEVAPRLPDPLGFSGVAGFSAWATFADQGVLDLSEEVSWSSSNPDVVAVLPATGEASAVDAGVADVEATFGPALGTASQAVVAAGPGAVLVWPPAATVPVGLPDLFAAERVLADGTVEDASGAAGWKSSCPAHVEVGNGVRGGATVARSAAACSIAAELGGLYGGAAVTATSPAVDSLEVDPAQVSLGAGGRVALTATAVFDDGSSRDVTALAAWISSDEAVVVAGNGPAGGQGLTTDAGVAQLTAAFGGALGVSTVTVGPGVPLLEIWPPLVQLHTRTQRALRATAVWPVGDALDVTAWTVFGSTDPAVAQVANADGRRGELSGLAPGTVTLSGVLGAAVATAGVTVDAAVPVALAVAAPTDLPAGPPARCLASAHFSDGSAMDVSLQSSWTSSVTGVFRVRGTGPDRGTALGISPGSASASARFAGLAASAPVTVSPGDAQALSLQGISGPLPAGVRLQLGARASYPESVEQDVTAGAVWTSSAPSVAVVSTGARAGLVEARTPGTTLIGIRYGGVQATAPLTVSAATLSGLTLLPAPPAGPVGVEVPLTARGTFSDGSQFDLTGQARWASADRSRVAVSNGERTRGAAMGLREGTTSVSASVARPDASVVNGTAAFLASAAVPVGVEVIPAQVTLSLGGSAPLTLRASAQLSDGTTRDVGASVAWAVDVAAVATVSPDGRLTAVAVGQTRVSATLGSLVGSASVQVVP